MAERGYIIFAHGSRVEPANEAVRSVATQFARAGGFEYVEAAFLELGRPDLEGAVAQLIDRGVRDLLVIPYFLTLGTHLERDLPKLAAQAAAAHPGVDLRVTPPLDGHAALVDILLDRAAGESQ
jgi:sirohydrochlorin ferrochelatase